MKLNVALCLLIFFIMPSCKSIETGNSLKNWQYKDINIDYVDAPLNAKDKKQITELTALYKTHPYEYEYNEIIFASLKVDKYKNRYFLFYIEYVDDIKVVFVFNENYEIQNNYLSSVFRSN